MNPWTSWVQTWRNVMFHATLPTVTVCPSSSTHGLFYTSQNIFQTKLCLHSVWDLGLEMWYNIPNYLFISEQSPETKICCAFVTLKWALYVSAFYGPLPQGVVQNQWDKWEVLVTRSRNWRPVERSGN